jgi:PAS domain S-box-containing protein
VYHVPDYGFRSLLQVLLQQTPMGFALLDPQLRYVLVNDALAAMTGMPADTMVGRSFAEVVPDLARTGITLMRQVLATGEPLVNHEMTGRTNADPTHDRVWVRSYHRITGENGVVLGVAALVVDVTDQRQQEQRLRNVLDALFTLVLVCDPEGTLLEANRAVLDIAGLTATDVVGRPLWETPWWDWDPDVQRGVRDAIGRAANGETSRYDVDIAVSDGHITIDLQIVPFVESGRVAALVVSASDVSDRRRRLEEMSALAAFASGLNAAMTTVEVDRNVSDAAVSTFGARFAAVSIVDSDGPTVLRAVRPESSPSELLGRFDTEDIDDHTPSADALRTGRPVLVANAAEAALRYPDLVEVRAAARLEATAALPLRRPGGHVFGVLSIGWADPVDFGQQTRLLVGTLAELCAQALQRTRLSDVRGELTRALQEQLLPSIPVIEGLDIAVRYLSAVSGIGFGGDWYDVVALDDHRAAIVIGDVVGHGIPAAARMAEIRSVINVLIRFGVSLDELFVRAESLLRHLDEPFLATVAVMMIDLERNELSYATAGHPPPLVTLPDGEVMLLTGGRQPPVGIVHETTVAPVVPFPAGASLIAYTDGLVERRGEDIDIGLTRFIDAATNSRGMDPRLVADLLIAGQTAGQLRGDDLALIVVRNTAAP